MTIAYILLGGNLGDRERFLNDAIAEIAVKAGKIQRFSSVYETRPWGFEHENNFLNQVVELETALNPQALLSTLLEIEESLGRIRTGQQNSARTIDIDILLYDDLQIHTETLEIPHPRMHMRKFVLYPLAEIAPGIVHPFLKKSIKDLLLCCDDKEEPRIFAHKSHIVIK